MVAPKEPFWRCKELLHRILPGYVVKYRHHHRAGPNVLVWLMGKRVAMFLLSTICIQLVRNLNVYLCAVRCVWIEKKKERKLSKHFQKSYVVTVIQLFAT